MLVGGRAAEVGNKENHRVESIRPCWGAALGPLADAPLAGEGFCSPLGGDASLFIQRLRKRVGGRGLATTKAQIAAKVVPQNYVSFS